MVQLSVGTGGLVVQLSGGAGGLVVQLPETMRYKPAGRGFDSRSCHSHSPETTSESTQPLREIFSEVKGGRCVGLTALPHSCADCLEIWEPQLPGTLRAYNWPDLTSPVSVERRLAIMYTISLNFKNLSSLLCIEFTNFT